MSTLSKSIFAILTITSVLFFTSCDDSSNDIPTELTIQNKVEILKSGEWLLKDYEDRVMHTFKDGKQFTYYGTDSVFPEEAIPGTQTYTIEGDQLTIDYNFGNVSTYDIKISCDNNIIEFYSNNELNRTLYKRGSDYMSCL